MRLFDSVTPPRARDGTIKGTVGWVERSDTHHQRINDANDGYRFAPPIQRALTKHAGLAKKSRVNVCDCAWGPD